MQFTPWDNPMGTDGLEFVEYAAPDPVALGKLFESMGFTAIARHRHKNVMLYRQGEINFIINGEPNSFAQRFARLLVDEIRVNKREVKITGSYAALAQAAAGNPGDFMSVPRFAPKWLPDLGSNQGPAD